MVKFQQLLNKDNQSIYRLFRCFGYFILSLILLVSALTEANVNFSHLLLIPFVILVLYFEPVYLQKIEYLYGKEVRKHVIFLIDVTLATLYIAAMNLLLIPSFIIIAAVVFSVFFNNINYVVVIASSVLAFTTFYLSSFFFFGFDPYLQSSSRELNILSIFCFMLFISLRMYYQIARTNQLKAEKEHYLEEMNRYLKLNNQLARYAPSQIWQSIMRGELEAKVEYQRRKLTIFFSDIEGFTSLSEKLIPEDLAFLLNDYLKHMTDIAKYYGGTVDKFMGDGILIFFGDPTSRGIKEDAIACLDMAVVMRQQMRILRERWMKMGYNALHIRMGVATGYCHVGNYGTIHRMSYTIVGRDANLASRLQNMAEVDQILISEETFNLVKTHFLCVKNAPLKLKGISEHVQSWQVVERYNQSNEEYKRWYDYEYKGFNLLLNLDKAQRHEYPHLIDTLQKTVDRLKLQQQKTALDGMVVLSEQQIVHIQQNADRKKEDNEKNKPTEDES